MCIRDRYISIRVCCVLYHMIFLVKCASVIVRMASVNKKYLSENEIVELLNVDSDSICSEISVEVFSENDSDPEFIPIVTNHQVSFCLHFITSSFTL